MRAIAGSQLGQTSPGSSPHAGEAGGEEARTTSMVEFHRSVPWTSSMDEPHTSPTDEPHRDPPGLF